MRLATGADMSVENRMINSELAKQEARIERGLVDAGNALLVIRDEKLYRVEHRTFEDYVKSRWGLSRSRAYQLIEASEVVDKVVNKMSKILDKSLLPANDSQLREIAKAPEEKQVEIVSKVAEKAAAENRKPTAADYRQATEEVEYEDAPEEVVVQEPSRDELLKMERKKARSYAEYLQRSVDDMNRIKRNTVLHPELIKLCSQILKGLERW
ncbi:MAG: hypothetical protein KDB22_26100 [Planctomycetales bacterium]|nr:hypothetical protein [Planctomycetales bacterium]